MRHVSQRQSSFLYLMFVSLIAMIYVIRVSCINDTAIIQTSCFKGELCYLFDMILDVTGRDIDEQPPGVCYCRR